MRPQNVRNPGGLGTYAGASRYFEDIQRLEDTASHRLDQWLLHLPVTTFVSAGLLRLRAG